MHSRPNKNPLFSVNWQFRQLKPAAFSVNWQFKRIAVDNWFSVNWQFKRLAPATKFGMKGQSKYNLLLLVTLTLSLLFSVIQPNQPLLAPLKVQPQLIQLAQLEPERQVSVIVQKTTPLADVESQVTELGGKVTKNLSMIRAFAATLPSSAVTRLSENNGVRWISIDAPAINQEAPCPTCIDSSILQNTYNKTVRADKAWTKWNASIGQYAPWIEGNGVGVAVVDSGINASVGDFGENGSRVIVQQNFASSSNSAADNYGHGTFVAGVIAGDGGSSNGSYVGIAPEANLISVKVSGDTGSATTSDLINGLQWILDNKATYNIRVVNISMNSSVQQSYNVDPLDAAVEILWFNQIVVVVSAGNNGNSGLFPPANDPFVITVGAVDEGGNTNPTNDTVASFSAYGIDETGGIKPDLVAPGKNLIAPLAGPNSWFATNRPANVVNGNAFRMSGTSAAAPVVSGAVALLLQKEPNLNPDQVKFRLKAMTLKGTPQGSWDNRQVWSNYNAATAGAGLVDGYFTIYQSWKKGTSNTGLPASLLLSTGSNPIMWGSVNWSSVNWSSVNWSSVNWSSVNWSSVNWSSAYWGN